MPKRKSRAMPLWRKLKAENNSTLRGGLDVRKLGDIKTYIREQLNVCRAKRKGNILCFNIVPYLNHIKIHSLTPMNSIKLLKIRLGRSQKPHLKTTKRSSSNANLPRKKQKLSEILAQSQVHGEKIISFPSTRIND